LLDLQQVYGDDGIKRHPLFFLGMGKKSAVSDSQLVSKSLSVMPADVQHERNIVASASAVTHGVIIKDLNKIYETDSGVPKMAVKTLSLAIPRAQCVGLLGPNGAGTSYLLLLPSRPSQHPDMARVLQAKAPPSACFAASSSPAPAQLWSRATTSPRTWTACAFL
jgi:hypothetical protein